MCGIFGFVAKQNKRVNLQLLSQIAVNTERRGPHSFGFAWIDSRNRLRMFKQTGRISNNLDLLHILADSRVLIGHCRWATHGTPDNNLNNHPHPCDGGWLVHNGMVNNHREINDEFGLMPVSQCDSETIGLLIEELHGTLIERVSEAMEYVARSNFALLAIWKNPTRLIVARAGNPLHATSTDDGVYLASLADELPNAKVIANDTVRSYIMRNGVLEMTRYDRVTV